MPENNNEVERLARLFPGNDRHHGTHGEPEWDDGKQKWGIRKTARTHDGGPTIDMWREHVDGRRPLGVIPITQKSLCKWGCGDIDEYQIDVVEIIIRVKRLGYPLVPCRSKSGGLHLFLFLVEPEPAQVVQATLRDMMASIGYGQAEVFPKQSHIMGDRDRGSWIIVPYFGGDYGGRVRWQRGIKDRGGEMTLGEFLTTAEGALTTTASIVLKKLSKRQQKGGSTASVPFGDGPVCLQHIISAGPVRTNQNNTLLMMGIYYKKAYPEDWQDHLERANREFLDPPGSAEGLVSVKKSLEKKDYEYTCKQPPMVDHCNSGPCRLRKYGVGGAGRLPTLSGLTKYDSDPPVYNITVEGERMAGLKPVQITDYRMFRQACFEKLDKFYSPMKDVDWGDELDRLLQDLTVIEAPEEAKLHGVVKGLLTKHVRDKAVARNPDGLLDGKPWEDIEGIWGAPGTWYISGPRLVKLAKVEGLRIQTGDLTHTLHEIGCTAIKGKNIEGVRRNIWAIPRLAKDKTEIIAEMRPLLPPPTREDKI